MKKLVLVGSTGVIGKKVKELFGTDYEVISVNRTSGDYQLDMADAEAVESMFKEIGGFDALISTSGYGKWASIDEHSIQDFHDGLNSKLMGQVNLVMIGRKYANAGASFAVSTGILAQYPVEGGLSLGMINAGLEAFVRGAALEMKEMNINAVSPSFAKETMELMGMDSTSGVPAIEFAKLYKEAIESGKSGEVYHVS
ncbi:short chain dehydrogenase [Marinifilum caeruleilacunae]|uniref:Short chain dehydrogenase n=1 Tax=Marinifilum caeruleilacunae TaxID=2499076 RepID=A0ABX1WQD9_9BACT|nr:short chain dehydrogenase [Marinifilum caeruleilacunae]NOU58300.1 short chain dehydrogenase [Marinifilum caeruleilacunae]